MQQPPQPHQLNTEVVNHRQSRSKIHRLENKTGNSTDSVCLGVWVVFLITYIILACFGLVQGNPSIIGKPIDPDHRACGVDLLVADYPFIYFVTPQDEYLYRTVCIATCPTSNQSSLQCVPNHLTRSCDTNLSPTDPSQQVLVYPTTTLLNIACLPTDYTLLKRITPALKLSLPQQTLHSVYNSELLITFSFFFSILIRYSYNNDDSCLIFKLVDRYSCLIIYAFPIVVIVSLLSLALNFYIEDTTNNRIALYHSTPSYTHRDQQGDLGIPLTASQVNAYVAKQNNNNSELMVFVFVFFVSGLFMMYQLKMQTKQMQKLEQALKIAEEFLSWNTDLIKVPIVVSIILGLNFFLYLFALMHLLSAGVYDQNPNSLPFNQFSFGFVGVAIAALITFIWLWISVTLCTLVDFITQALVVHWYDQQRFGEVQRNYTYFNDVVKNVIRLHLGSIALCSLLIVLVSPFKFILSPLKFFQKQIESVLDCKCTGAFLRQFQAFIHFYDNQVVRVDTDSYMIIYLSSQNFATSSAELVVLVDEHQTLYQQIHKLGDLFTHRGALCMALVSAIFAYVVCKFSAKQIVTPEWPAFCVAIMAYQVGYVFMGILGEAIQGLCCMYIQDREIINARYSYGTKAPLIVHNCFYLIEKLTLSKDEMMPYEQQQ